MAVLVPAARCRCVIRSIAELKRNPGRYQDHTVNIDGVVTSSWGVPLVPFRFYKVDDGTGEITVLSQSSRDADAQARACSVKGAVERGRRARRARRSACTSAKSRSTCSATQRGDLHARPPSCRRSAASSPRNSCTAVEDRVDDLARRLVARARSTTSQQPLGAELRARRVDRLEHAVRAEHEQVAGAQVERRPRRRSSRRTSRAARPAARSARTLVAAAADRIRQARVRERHDAALEVEERVAAACSSTPRAGARGGSCSSTPARPPALNRSGVYRRRNVRERTSSPANAL